MAGMRSVLDPCLDPIGTCRKVGGGRRQVVGFCTWVMDGYMKGWIVGLIVAALLLDGKIEFRGG